MSDVYEYRTLRIRRAAWRDLAIAGAALADPPLFALFAGMIGFANDEGVMMRAWPEARAVAEKSGPRLPPQIIESGVERLLPTVRPMDATPPAVDGVYAHRWFWLQPQDWAEFQRLSEDGIWPYFESDGCAIVGLWRSMEPGPLAAALLITRYPSVAHWERTRLQSSEPPPGADERLYRQAQDAGRRRAEITERSIVRLTRLVVPPQSQRS